MAYTRVNWEDLPSTNTPINATNLNKMDKGIKDLDDAVIKLEDTNSGTLSSSPETKYERIGRVVSIYCHVTSSTTINAYNSLVIGTLPNDCKPLLPVRTSASAKTSGNAVVNGLILRILDNGIVDIQNWTNSNLTFAQLDASITYLSIDTSNVSLLSVQNEGE